MFVVDLQPIDPPTLLPAGKQQGLQVRADLVSVETAIGFIHDGDSDARAAAAVAMAQTLTATLPLGATMESAVLVLEEGPDVPCGVAVDRRRLKPRNSPPKSSPTTCPTSVLRHANGISALLGSGRAGNGCRVSHVRSLLSEGVLSNDLVATNRNKIAAENIDTTAVEQGAGQSPLRYAVVIGEHEVSATTPVRVRHRVEHISERGPDLIPTHEPAAIRFGSAGSIEHAIVSEQTHQSLNVMAVPCFGVFDEQTFQILTVHIRPPCIEITSCAGTG